MADARSTSRASSVEVEGYVDKQQEQQVQQQEQQQQQGEQQTQQEGEQPQTQQQPEQHSPQSLPDSQDPQQQPPPEQYHLQFPAHPPAPKPTPPHFYPSAEQVTAVAFHHNADASSGKSVRWSNRDDVLLGDALLVQHFKGRNRFNGVFHVDAWEEVAESMRGSELVTGGAPKNLAHCKARWQRLKVEYRAVKLLRNEPGFAWDEATQMVIASPQTWDAYITKHKDAQPWRKKKFPCYSRCAFLIEDEQGRDKGDVKFKKRWEANTGKRGNSPGRLVPVPTTELHENDRDAIGEIDPALTSMQPPVSVSVSSAPPPAITGGATSVFPIVRADHNGTKFVHRFAHDASSAEPPPATTSVPPQPTVPSQPLSPRTISSAIQQYQSQINGNGKRTYPAEYDQESISKRANTNIGSAAPITYSQGAHAPPPPAASSVSPVPPPAPAPVSYTTAVPVTAATAATAPPLPPTTSTSSISAPPHPAPTSLSLSLSPPSSSSTPSSRLTEAITSLESTFADDGLSELQFVKAIQLFQRRADALEAFLAIQSRRARVMYVKAELAEIGAGAGGS